MSTPPAVAPLARTFLPITVLLVGALLLVPYATLEAIRQAVPGIGRALTWLHGFAPTLDMEHLVAFAALGALACLAQGQRRRPVRTMAWLALFSLATELSQAWVPTRSPTAEDFLLNLGGTALGYALGAMLLRLQPVRRGP